MSNSTHRSGMCRIFLRQAKTPHTASRNYNNDGLPVTKTDSVARPLFNFLALIVAIFSLSSCASVNVASKDEMFAGREKIERECYSYDTQRSSVTRNLKTAVPLGILSLALGPVGTLVAGVGSGIAMQGDNSPPTKCGLTVDDAVKAASDMAFEENSTAVWRQIKDNSKLVVKVTPLSQRGKCSIQNLELTKKLRTGDSTRFSERIEACGSKERQIAVANRSDAKGDTRPSAKPETPTESKPSVVAAPLASHAPPATVAPPAASALPTGYLPSISTSSSVPTLTTPLAAAPSPSVAPSSPSTIASLRKDQDQAP